MSLTHLIQFSDGIFSEILILRRNYRIETENCYVEFKISLNSWGKLKDKKEILISGNYYDIKSYEYKDTFVHVNAIEDSKENILKYFEKNIKKHNKKNSKKDNKSKQVIVKIITNFKHSLFENLFYINKEKSTFYIINNYSYFTKKIKKPPISFYVNH